MTPPLRAASAAAIVALISATIVGGVIYGSLSGESGASVIGSALTLGFASAACAFVAILIMARSRHPNKRPVIGVARGAAAGTGVLLFVSASHAVLNPGAAGILASLIGQTFFSLILFGWFAAAIGGIFGRYIDRIAFSDSGI